jgi:Tfp pilus assembly protein PilF
VDYRNSLAAALDRIGQFDQAFEQWKEVIGQDPTDLDARNNLADMLARHGLNDRAKEEYRAVLRIDPKNAHATDRLRRIEPGK